MNEACHPIGRNCESRSNSAAGGGLKVRHPLGYEGLAGGFGQAYGRGAGTAPGRSRSGAEAPPRRGRISAAFEPCLGVLEPVAGAVGLEDVNPVGGAAVKLGLNPSQVRKFWCRGPSVGRGRDQG